ncbi:MAG: diacylglycerol/lipid kinase family protein [Candidatus Heimdallarchaeota archaeon]
METEVFFVVNPTAAGGRVGKIWTNQIHPLLEANGIDFDFKTTTDQGNAINVAQERVNEGYRIICSVGGDGTSNEVLNGVLKAKKPGIFAAFPVGTGNDIPISFGIPDTNIEEMYDCLVSGQDKEFDVGYCEKADRYFGGVASMGFDAEVAARTQTKRRLFGRWNYELALLKTILNFRPYNIKIEYDNESVLEGQRMIVAIGNGKRYGAGMHVCPKAKVTDGKFFAVTLSKISRFTLLLRVFPKIYDGKHIEHKKVLSMEGSVFRVESPDKECLYQADGEILGYLPETFVTRPNLLTVRVPDPWVSYTEIWEKKLEAKGKK